MMCSVTLVKSNAKALSAEPKVQCALRGGLWYLRIPLIRGICDAPVIYRSVIYFCRGDDGDACDGYWYKIYPVEWTPVFVTDRNRQIKQRIYRQQKKMYNTAHNGENED